MNLVWLATLAWAAPKAGTVTLLTSEDARVVAFPRVDAQRIDVGIYGNRVPLDEQLEGRTSMHLKQAWATSIGGGTWFVTLHVDPTTDIAWTHEGGRLVLQLAPDAHPVVVAPEPMRVDELVASPPPRRPAPPIPLTLHPLRGDATTLAMDAVDGFRGMPEVVTPSVQTWAPSLEAIDLYRAAFTDPATGEDVRAQALARAGVAYTDLDLPREAVHYLTRAIEAGKADPATVLALARAEVARGRGDEATHACRLAARQRASEEDVLACFVAVSYMSPELPASEFARALARRTRDPHRLWMAAQRLQADHRHDEALVILERLEEVGTPGMHASLGDARQATGDLDGALLSWRHAQLDRIFRERMTVRIAMAEMVKNGPESFGASIPELLLAPDTGGVASAERHYLLAQIAQVYGDPDLAAEQLNLLWSHHPERAERSDAPERLVATCTWRLGQLAGMERHVDLVTFFGDCWRRQLDGMVVDTRALTAASRSMAALGLADEALALQLRAVEMIRRHGLDDPDGLLWMAELYVRTGRAEEALDTLAFLGKGKVPPALAADVARVEGDARLAVGDPEAAVKAWKRVVTPETQRLRALLAAQDGDCATALPLLDAFDDEDAVLAAARCLLREGDADGAARRVSALEPEAASPADDDVGWLASVARWAGATDEAAPATGVWQALLDEEAANTAWADERGIARFR